jgi:autotransporter-associated beta strand protein
VGDFSGITVDPSTGTTYWAANEYAISTTDLSLPNWGTWITNFQLSFNWTGDGTTSNWSDPHNWGIGVAPGAGANLEFGPAAAKFTSTNDLPNGTKLGRITFIGGGYTITGNSIALAGALDGSAATGSNSFGPNITLSAAETFLAGSGSTDLTVGGKVNDNGFALTIGGGNGKIDLTNVISGSGGLKENGSGTLVLSSSNSYAGGTTLLAGTLMVGNNSALSSGALTIQAGTISATGGARSLANPITLAGNSTIGGSFALTLNGGVTLTGNRTLTVSNKGTTTIAGAVGQSTSGLGLTKAGAGTLVLSASNTYTGLTTVSGGTLLVNGSITGAVSVAASATLAGSGTTGAVTVSSGGVLLPGSSGQPGILSTGGVNLNGGANFNVALNGPTPGAGGYAQLIVSGTVSLNNSNLNVTVGYAATVGASFTIIKNNGPNAVSGTFNNLPEGAKFVVGGMTFQITYKGGTSGKDVVITRVA